MPKLTVTIIAQDEAAHIADALTSVAWADERIVVDSGSTDGTLEIARSLATRVEVREWSGYGAQKNAAAALASHDWVLSLDADERITPALAAEIQRVVGEANQHVVAYRMPRVTWYLGQWIRSTDWYPDSALRLYNRRHATWGDELVHESLHVNGGIGTLTGEIEHRPYDDVADHLQRINQYTTLAATQMHRQGRRASVWQIIGHPCAAFLRNYLARGGARQGSVGLVVSLLNATYVFLKFAKLYEQGLRGRDTPDPRSPIRDPRSPIRDPN